MQVRVDQQIAVMTELKARIESELDRRTEVNTQIAIATAQQESALKATQTLLSVSNVYVYVHVHV
jgi:hypothetical protein